MPEISIATPIPGPKSSALLARKHASVPDGVGIALPAFIEQAKGAILTDVDGNRFIDLGSGIAVTALGHAHPKVVDVVQRQIAAFAHTAFGITPYDGYIELAELVATLTPGDFDKRTLFVNTGAEALENAVKIARRYTGKPGIVVFDHAFHGRTNLTMAMTAKQAPYKSGFGPFAPEIYRVPGSYPYRDGLTGPEAAARTITQIETQVGAANLAAIVIEPIQGEGGFLVPAPGFLPALQAWARENGVVFVVDEVQSGFARTGDMFASEFEALEPDVITMAKGIGGGLPLAAVTGRAEIMNASQPGGLGGTYGGNPVSIAAALATIGVIIDEDLPAKARAIGEVLLERLGTAASTDDRIGEIRGRGAMIAAEFVVPGSKTPNPEAAEAVLEYLHSHGVIALECGTYGNVVRFLPPLVITEAQLDEALDVFDEALTVTR